MPLCSHHKPASQLKDFVQYQQQQQLKCMGPQQQTLATSCIGASMASKISPAPGTHLSRLIDIDDGRDLKRGNGNNFPIFFPSRSFCSVLQVWDIDTQLP